MHRCFLVKYGAHSCVLFPPDIKWQPITTSAGWAGGAGALSFELLNGRHAYEFKYFRGDDVLVTSSSVAALKRFPYLGSSVEKMWYVPSLALGAHALAFVRLVECLAR